MLRLLSSTRVCTRLVNPAARTAAAAAVRPHRLPAMGLAPTHRTEAPARSYSASGHPSQAQAPTVAPLTPFRTHTPAPTASTSTPLVYTFYHDATSTWTYLVVDPATQHCAIIDSVLDYDPASHTVSTQTADALAAFVEQQGLVVDRIFETHAHADHLTAAAYLQLRLSPLDGAADGATRVPIGAHSGIRSTQAHFAQMYDVPPGELESAFDELYEEGDELHIGNLRGVVWHLPGHTMCSAGFVFGDSVFTGDSVLLVRDLSCSSPSKRVRALTLRPPRSPQPAPPAPTSPSVPPPSSTPRRSASSPSRLRSASSRGTRTRSRARPTSAARPSRSRGSSTRMCTRGSRRRRLCG